MENTIEREIEIAATVERVWELVSEPGWWINDGAIKTHQIVPHQSERVGAVNLVTDPVHGTFAIATLAQDPPRYVCFGWQAGTEGAQLDETRTTVEFWVTATAGDRVVLRVVETGFAALPVSPVEQQEAYDDNVNGWKTELDAARTHLEDR